MKAQAFSQKSSPDAEPVWTVHRQNVNSGASDGGSSNDSGCFPTKMFRPTIPAWIEKSHGIWRLAVEAGNVIEFMTVTMWAGVGKVFWFVAASMLASHNMVTDESQLREITRKEAILAATGGTLSHDMLVSVGHAKSPLLVLTYAWLST